MSKPRLIVTLGDPAGIGTEVVLKALSDRSLAESELTLIGNRELLIERYDYLRQQVPSTVDLANPADLNIIDVSLPPAIRDGITIGLGNAASGAASFKYLDLAIDRTLAGEFDAVVTAPIAKSSWLAAGHHFPGQTELLASKAKIDRFGMLFVGISPHTGWTLRTLLATTHLPLDRVAQTLTPELLSLKLGLLVECLQVDFGLDSGTIAIAGLNPHSGEGGQLGREEVEWMDDWLDREREIYPQYKLLGLLPPDTMWVKPGQAWFGTHPQPQAADAYLALYHDQGLIPVKLMAFDRAINTTIGLPYVRTSPDHGTAFDIAKLGIADDRSMKAAIQLAGKLVTSRYQR
ncbi:4-hydroxythreonine-4-phosphate dehydrogenase PdxA [Chamaesiphon polymorphus]|uniref:4-hydroxythreonine-4-phosphate dehydrogenase n=1 Tax=Chamaesiphon polymorphus CCALA 037 TaxID=2107692 RepID=A0A2T1GJ45_9CYAN|nr:4-hydroxythreonine-4-phosphate dehydrogenase PdxA [Chamaesiphon polymorphus]PSB57794.1 4-hydroxythreonine-4-phosphate dehydrogenase PdxA [Chamaesiphon polymorphus CCALA 037]